jgi:hypothetical protein
MGIAFNRGTIHVGAGVSLVGVTDDIFDVPLGLAGQIPLEPCGETGPAAAPEPGDLYLFDDLFGSPGKKNFFKARITFPGDVFIDIFRIDHTAVAEHDPELLLIELDVFDGGSLVFGVFFPVEEPGDFPAFDDLLGDDLAGVFGFYSHIEGFFRKYLDDGALLAKTETAGFNDLNLLLDILLLRFLKKTVVNFVSLVGFTGSSSAAEDKVVKGHIFLLFHDVGGRPVKDMIIQ